MVEMYGPERLLVNSAGDWGPSKPTAVPDFILAMRLRGHPESLIRRVVYDNPLEFFSQSRGFQVHAAWNCQGASGGVDKRRTSYANGDVPGTCYSLVNRCRRIASRLEGAGQPSMPIAAAAVRES